ncbi:MAG: GDSL-type esterase/lipase family protein [Eubacteriales bacterium]|nr:GDSL-type esterase/lipase family protein [Eubacteriales bacterium]
MEFKKWVACWGCGTSITNQKEARYAKDLTLRYPIRMCFSGNALRFRFTNVTGKEDVTLRASVAKWSADGIPTEDKGTHTLHSKMLESYDIGSFRPEKYDTGDSRLEWYDEDSIINLATCTSITSAGEEIFTIPAGEELESDAISFDVTAGETVIVSIYLPTYTDMNAGVLVTGPLSSGYYSYGNYEKSAQLPTNLTRHTNWFYFLNTIDIYTEECNHALVCFGDSITAQSWPDYLALRAWKEGYHNVSIIRRAVSGTRILRQYHCITYAAYGLKGERRFPLEINTAGADTVILQHGINDIIHPVGVESNRFRPMSDLPTADEMKEAVKNIYIAQARELGLKVWGGTLLPILGWRTFADFREEIRLNYNDWLLHTDLLDGCIDFGKALQDEKEPRAFAPINDSGDHLHPSEEGYNAMAMAVPAELLK